ncbi:MAG TPA: hypothetical protein VG225_00525 [Terracidiphilus sp.]|jgi:hypothetical protein|nr:hypothetical protein [Terracidiphilus sp.]
MRNEQLVDKKCWAASLGDCSGGISREHLVSQSLFPTGSVVVQGLHWCKDEPKPVGIESLTSKILCRKHNSDLSDVDSAAKRTFDTFVESMRLLDARRNLHLRRYTMKRFTINGLLLERWFLKTLINIGFDREWIIGEGGHPAGEPSEELVEIAFGKAKFRPKAGLYTAAYAGENVTVIYDGFGLHYTPKTIGNSLLAGGFTFGGYRFFLNLLPQELREHQGSDLIYRTVRHWYQVPDDKGRQVKSHRLDITWP